MTSTGDLNTWTTHSASTVAVTYAANLSDDSYGEFASVCLCVEVYQPTITAETAGPTELNEASAPANPDKGFALIRRDAPIGYVGPNNGDDDLPITYANATLGGSATYGEDYVKLAGSGAFDDIIPESHQFMFVGNDDLQKVIGFQVENDTETERINTPMIDYDNLYQYETITLNVDAPEVIGGKTHIEFKIYDNSGGVVDASWTDLSPEPSSNVAIVLADIYSYSGTYWDPIAGSVSATYTVKTYETSQWQHVTGATSPDWGQPATIDMKAVFLNKSTYAITSGSINYYTDLQLCASGAALPSQPAATESLSSYISSTDHIYTADIYFTYHTIFTRTTVTYSSNGGQPTTLASWESGVLAQG